MLRDWYEKLSRHGVVVATTAMPGVQSLVTMSLIAQLTGVEALGRVAGDLGIASFIGFFSGIGWSSFLLIRLPRLNGARQAQMFSSVTARSVVLNALMILPVWGLACAGVVSDWLGTSIYLLGWSGYQLVRHYELANRNYRTLLSYDIFCLAGTIPLVYVAADHEPYILLAMSATSICLSLAFAVVMMSRCRIAGIMMFPRIRSVWKLSQAFAASNAMSGGIGALLPPVMKSLSGDLYAGVLAVILNIVRMLILFPRALSYQQLVALTKLAGARDWRSMKMRIASFRRQIIVILTAITGVVALAWMMGAYRLFNVDPETRFLHFGFLLGLAGFFASQLVLPESNLIAVLEKTKTQMAVNASSLVVFVVCIGAMYAFGAAGAAAFVGLLVAQLLATGARIWWTIVEFRKICAILN